MENNPPNTDHGEQQPDEILSEQPSNAGLAWPPTWYTFSPTDCRIMSFLEMKIQNQILPMNDIVDNNIFSKNETPENCAGNNSQKPLFLNSSVNLQRSLRWSSVFYFVYSIVKIVRFLDSEIVSYCLVLWNFWIFSHITTGTTYDRTPKKYLHQFKS